MPKREDGRISLCRGHTRPQHHTLGAPLLSGDNSHGQAPRDSNSAPPSPTPSPRARFQVATYTDLPSLRSLGGGKLGLVVAHLVAPTAYPTW